MRGLAESTVIFVSEICELFCLPATLIEIEYFGYTYHRADLMWLEDSPCEACSFLSCEVPRQILLWAQDPQVKRHSLELAPYLTLWLSFLVLKPPPSSILFGDFGLNSVFVLLYSGCPLTACSTAGLILTFLHNKHLSYSALAQYLARGS